MKSAWSLAPLSGHLHFETLSVGTSHSGDGTDDPRSFVGHFHKHPAMTVVAGSFQWLGYRWLLVAGELAEILGFAGLTAGPAGQ